MNWAKECAQEIIRPLKPLIHRGMTPQQYDAMWDAIAASLQRVADGCAYVVDKVFCEQDWRTAQAISEAADAIRVRFAKEDA